MADLTPEELKFFETGELQPGMVPEPPAVPTSASPAAVAPPPPPVTPPAAIEPPPTTNPSDAMLEILRRSLADEQARTAQLQAQIDAAGRVKPPELPAPDQTTDPLGYMLHQLNKLTASVTEMQTTQTQQQTQQQQMGQLQQFQQHVRTMRDEFARTTPDFSDAYDHIRNSRMSDLKMMGLPTDQIQQALFQDELALAQAAIRIGRNPAEVVYEMAKRHGYMPKAPAPNPQAKVASLQQSTQAAAPVPPSTPNPADFTTDGLKVASESDLDRLVQDDRAWAKLVGKSIDIFPN